MSSDGLPQFIGIGAAKSGTTWLARNLSRHPEVFVPQRKELNSFDYHEFDEACVESYKRHFRCPREIRVTGEFSTIYLQSERAPPRIRRLIPDVKLLVSLRNPIEQIYSHYWHLRRQNFHQGAACRTPLSIEDAIDRYPHLLIEPASYFKHLSRWRRLFAEDQMLIVFFDDIVLSPSTVLETVWAFLGIESLDCPRSDARRVANLERAGVSPKAQTLERLHGVLYARMVRHLYNPMKKLMGPRRAATVKDRLRVRQIMERIFYRRGYPSMSARLRDVLRARMSEEIESLAGLTGRDLSHWT